MELVNLMRYFDMMPNIAVFYRADIYQQINELHTCNSDAVLMNVTRAKEAVDCLSTVIVLRW